MHISLTPPDFITESVVETSPVNSGNQTSGNSQSPVTKPESSSQIQSTAPIPSSCADDIRKPDSASPVSSGSQDFSLSMVEKQAPAVSGGGPGNNSVSSTAAGPFSEVHNSGINKPLMHLKEDKDGIYIKLSGSLDLKKSRFLWNGKPVFTEDGEFFLKMEEDGQYSFSYELIDQNGQVIESREEIFVQDTQAPEIITKDFDDTFWIYEKGEMPVEIEDASATALKIYIDGKQIDADGGILVDVSMSTIRIEAMDEHGNCAEKTIQIEKLPDPLDGSLPGGWKIEAQPSLEQDQMTVLLWDGEELVESFPFDQAQQILLNDEKNTFTLFIINAQGNLCATKNLILKDESPVLKPSDLTEPETENTDAIFEEEENTLTFITNPSTSNVQSPAQTATVQNPPAEIQNPSLQQIPVKTFLSAGARSKDELLPLEKEELFLKWNNKKLDQNFPVFLAEKELDDFQKENGLLKDLSFFNPATGKHYSGFRQALEEAEEKMLYIEGTIKDEKGNLIDIMQPVMEKQQLDWNQDLGAYALTTRFFVDQEGKLFGKVSAESLSSPLFSLQQVKNANTNEKELRLYAVDDSAFDIEVNGVRLEKPQSCVDEKGVKYFIIPKTRSKMHVSVYGPGGNLLYEDDVRVDGPLIFALFSAFTAVLAVPVLFEWKKRGYLKYFKSRYEVTKVNASGASSRWLIRKRVPAEEEKIA